jgi:hypothetical protein
MEGMNSREDKEKKIRDFLRVCVPCDPHFTLRIMECAARDDALPREILDKLAALTVAPLAPLAVLPMYVSDVDMVCDQLWLGSIRARYEISKLNITTVVCLMTRSDHIFSPLLPLGVAEHHFELQDRTDEPLATTLAAALPVLDAAIKRGENVLVHCWAGISRSPALVCAYLMKRDRCCFADALAVVRKARACVNPNRGFRAVLETMTFL